jgi:sugar lactone lactonase YvrE
MAETTAPAELVELECGLGESPVWIAAEDRIASVDIDSNLVHIFEPASGSLDSIDLGTRTTAIVPAKDGRLALIAGRRIIKLDVASMAIETLIDDPSWPPPGTTFNDAKADRTGRLWLGARHSGTSGDDGAICRWSGETGQATVVVGMRGPNGIAWNTAGDRLFVADSRSRRIWCFEFDEDVGSCARPRVFATFSDGDGAPDGLAVDVDDHLWCSFWDGGAVRRIDPTGRVDRTIHLPTRRPTSCAFGGVGRDRLWVTSARTPGSDGSDLGGSLFAVDVDRPGIAESLMA